MILYNVNKEKRVVVARFDTNGMTDHHYWRGNLRRELDRLTTNNAFYFFNEVENRIIEAGLARADKRFVGVAKCSPEDEWNEEIGKALAKKRLLWKWNLVRLGAIEALSNEFANLIAHVNERKYNLTSRLGKSKIQVNLHTN